MLHNSMASSIRRIHKPFHRKGYHSHFLDQILVSFKHCLYEGLLHDGTLTVAVKPYGAEEFRTELQLLSQLRHQNLVRLFGFCKQKDERMLVYEYLNNEALRDHLHKGGDPLPWKQRLEICIGAARGLHYLHTGAKYTVIHRNVKSSNIILDENWAAKLANFGVSKMVPPSTSKPKVLTKTNSRVAGTFGYMAPKYMMNGELSEKYDAFSFGVVLFEVLCGRSAYKHIIIEGNVVSWICKCIKAGSIHDIIDPYLKGKIAPVCLIEFLEIAFSCIHPKANERPTMGEVEVTLELALECRRELTLL
ncbi:hypothetical protein SLEP1_g10534 [Rubroshorea leprosula]|uniref:Protein kinase domain-containing protein n=1 Tax=Rubroshorea leprosula TaxID=152421 RepID=A0AAV5IE94_9ROSI|nr:hypothetical protein SLEP1_g10534 [Rubroshorea leprosula]